MRGCFAATLVIMDNLWIGIEAKQRVSLLGLLRRSFPNLQSEKLPDLACDDKLLCLRPSKKLRDIIFCVRAESDENRLAREFLRRGASRTMMLQFFSLNRRRLDKIRAEMNMNRSVAGRPRLPALEDEVKIISAFRGARSNGNSEATAMIAAHNAVNARYALTAVFSTVTNHQP